MSGSSSSDSTKKVTTTTTLGDALNIVNPYKSDTTIGDIGLTGQGLINYVSVLEQGRTDRAIIEAGAIDKLMQGVGDNYNRLIGGANDLIIAAPAIAAGNTIDEDSISVMGKYFIPLIMVGAGFLIWKGGK